MGSWKVTRGYVLGYEFQTCGVYHEMGLFPPVKVEGTVLPNKRL
jgi:hypothetical protein